MVSNDFPMHSDPSVHNCQGRLIRSLAGTRTRLHNVADLFVAKDLRPPTIVRAHTGINTIYQGGQFKTLKFLRIFEVFLGFLVKY